MSAAIESDLKRHVERIVRPVRARWQRKVRMREDLLAHLQAAFAEERPRCADDAEALVSFHSHLSPDSIYRRYFAMHPLLSPSEVSHLTQVDYQERLALIILDGEEIVAVGRYDGLPPGTTAEVAFLVRDDFQRRGLGRILLNKLASAAWLRGLTRFSAVTMSENRGMITVFQHCGFPVKLSADGEERYVTFPIDPAMRTSVASVPSQPENR